MELSLYSLKVLRRFDDYYNSSQILLMILKTHIATGLSQIMAALV